MRLSTVTNMFITGEDGSAIPLEESMKRCKEIGFDSQDVSVSGSQDKNHPLNNNGWERWIDSIGELKEKLGISFDSAHLPFYGMGDPAFAESEEKRAFFDRAKYRSIHACGIWGVKWVAEHIVYNGDDAGTPEFKKKNYDYHAPYVEAAAKAGTGIAFENLGAKYPATALDLADFLAGLNSPVNAGVCWDFGHGRRAGLDQCAELRELGGKLKATHVHDNWGKGDSHLVPFVGTIVWEPIMKTLGEIGYNGNFTLELGNYNRGKPDIIQTMHARHAYNVGQYLLSLV